MKLMKVFDISEFSEIFQEYFISIIYSTGYIEIDLAGRDIPSLFIDELVEKGCLLDEKVLVTL